MNNSSTYPLRLPKSLKDEVTKLARRDGTSLNQFIAIAVAEKVSAMETKRYFAERTKRADPDAFRAILSRNGGEPPRQGDALKTCSEPLCVEFRASRSFLPTAFAPTS